MSRVVLYHSTYGCETGCCGHRVEIDDREVEFTFAHPDHNPRWGQIVELSEADRDWVRQVVTTEAGAEHVADIDWNHCLISND